MSAAAASVRLAAIRQTEWTGLSGIVLNLGAGSGQYTAVLSNNASLTTNIFNPVTLTNTAAGKNKFVDNLQTKTFKANALTLERYRHGSVLFAGDAAHLRLDEKVGLDAGMGMRHAVPGQHAFSQFAGVLNLDLHRLFLYPI